MSRCSCGAEVVYLRTGYGLRVLDAGAVSLRLHNCPPSPAGNIHECICGAIVVDEGDTRLNWPERTPHEHRRRRQPQQAQPKAAQLTTQPAKEPASVGIGIYLKR